VSKKWYSYFVVTDETKAAGVPAPDAPAPPPVRVSDLVPEAPAVAPPLVTPTATPDLSVVYDAAKITPPPHGYTVLKIAEMLASEHIRELPPEVRRKSVMVALDAAGVKIDEIVQDAVRRDRALDTYERVLQQNVDELSASVAAENRRLEEEIARRVAELRAQIDENGKRLAADQAELQAWRARKHQEEALIAETVAHFVTENPITRGGAHTGDADAR
jgi:Asp-tRNA(Asn)/Glu-tRNA(Gln) amidotransferase A subunit family amidase